MLHLARVRDNRKSKENRVSNIILQSHKRRYAGTGSSRKEKNAIADGKKTAGTRVAFLNVVILRPRSVLALSRRDPSAVPARFVFRTFLACETFYTLQKLFLLKLYIKVYPKNIFQTSDTFFFKEFDFLIAK